MYVDGDKPVYYIYVMCKSLIETGRAFMNEYTYLNIFSDSTAVLYVVQVIVAI